MQKLVKEPEVQGSQLLRTFLTDTADVSLFMPNTMGDKAGKLMVQVVSYHMHAAFQLSVPHILYMYFENAMNLNIDDMQNLLKEILRKCTHTPVTIRYYNMNLLLGK